jgi:hypothetical protein
LRIELHSGVWANATSENVQRKASSAIILILPLTENLASAAIPRFSVIQASLMAGGLLRLGASGRGEVKRG